jgi:hypothetical protein
MTTIFGVTEMSDSSSKVAPSWASKGLMWLALGLFAMFFLSVALQRFESGLLDISAAQEAVLLVIATTCFISACLGFEARQGPAS